MASSYDEFLPEPELQIVEVEGNKEEDQNDFVSNIIIEYEVLNKRCDEILSRISARKKQSSDQQPS